MQVLAKRHPVIGALLAVVRNSRGGAYRADMAPLVAQLHCSPSNVLRQLAAVAASREIRFEMCSKKALAWQLLRPQPSEQEQQALAVAMHARLQAVDGLQTARIDILYGILAAAAKAGQQQEQEQVR